MNSSICKQLIVDYCKNHTQELNDQFCEELSSTEFAAMQDEKNWKREEKYKEDGVIVRRFDCRPFDDQLRAYISTDLSDTKVISVIVGGE
jgi:hypothetical protein